MHEPCMRARSAPDFARPARAVHAVMRIRNSGHAFTRSGTMGPYPHDAPAAQVTAANPMGTDGFEFVEYAHPRAPRRSRPLPRHGLSAVARHRTKAITVYPPGRRELSLVNEEPGATATVSSPPTALRPPRWRYRVVDAEAAYDRAIALGAEPADPADGERPSPCRRSRASAARCSISSRPTAQGLTLRGRVRMLAERDPRPAGSACYLPRSPDPQRASRAGWASGAGSTKRSSTSGRSATSTSRASRPAVLEGADLARRQDPHPDQRIGRREEPDRGIPARL